MDDKGLLQEIEDDLARKRLEALWKKYGNAVVGAAMAIVFLTAGYSGYKTYKTSHEQGRTSAFLEIVEEAKLGRTEKMAKLEEYAKEQKGKPLAALAQFAAAAQALEGNETDKAVAKYNEIATDSSVDPLFRQLADLLFVQSQLDTAEPAQLEARLAPLLKPDCAWRASAMEYAGYLAIRQGDKEKAKNLFKELRELPGLTREMAMRVNDLYQWLNKGA
ncbi:MAG: tetratricopeptide repeat protein [Alphaproteobacteria bacterium]|nr:tetratricopeptide repeat protein [Alphaproteobacteria bacterium]